MKKILLTAGFVCAAMSAYAEHKVGDIVRKDGFVYEVTATPLYTSTISRGGYLKVVDYEGNDEIVTVPSSVDFFSEGEYEINCIGSFAFFNNDKIKGIRVTCSKYNNGEKIDQPRPFYVDKYAFASLENLESLTIDGPKEIEEHAIHACINLKNIDITGNGLKKLPSTAFYNLPSLTNLTITYYEGDSDNGYEGNEDSGKYKTINNTSVIIEDDMNIVYCAEGLTEYPYHINHDRNLIVKEGAFFDSKITELDLSTFDLIEPGAFKSSRLKKVTCAHALSSHLDAGTFAGCNSLEQVYFGEDSYTDIPEGCFEDCINLKGVATYADHVSERAFKGCDRLKDIYFLGNAPMFDSDVFTADNINAYLVNEPSNTYDEVWSHLNIKQMPSSDVVAPTVSVENGQLRVTTPTADHHVAYTVELKGNTQEMTDQPFTITRDLEFVVKAHSYCLPFGESEEVEYPFTVKFGDMNMDGQFSVEDVTRLVNRALN